MLENKFQANLIKELKERFPGCIVMKNDPTYIQGIPDLLVLHKDKWASLECKKSAGAKKQPNQEYYVDRMNQMSFSSLIVLEGTVLDMMDVYEDLDNHIIECGYDVRCFGYDPYNAKEFVERWASENGPFGIEKVIQGAKTESVPLGELKKLSEERMLLFDEDLMTFAMGNCITLEDTNGNRKLLKKRYEQKIDAVAAMMDAYIAFKANREAFE